ncbi:protein kinase domain-containing protein [Colletotrichum orchidophilum]|uniref:Protein kinase domain-containing protein n=1 Tax=Colletotrichum orchidophilum TaxID=1209926 RepID=A0A1G4AUR4_9PEZI|nr:protein kinase domain-containing protein [Colletotrichum orchidophilum]OHE92907.1 protein kinase domain-containing protein [Colletotrichum orchidophilum]
MLTFKGIRKALQKAEREVSNTRDVRTYTWTPLSSINNIIQDNSHVVKALEEKIRMSDSMKRFIFGRAKRLVSLLIRLDRLDLLQRFHGEQFGDEDFPIRYIKPRTTGNKSRPKWSIQSCRSDKTVSSGVVLDEDDSDDEDDNEKEMIRQFCNTYQWRFFVPVFSPHDKAHVFDPRCQMPYLEELGSNQTNFSVVRHFVIHRTHLNFKLDDQIGTLVDGERNPHIAVKELLSAQGLSREKFAKVAENEATILKRLRDQDHPHFIRAIATYTQGNRYYFVFPWARGGNLRDFWANQPTLHVASTNINIEDWSSYFEWFFEQLLGLSGAIESLHHPEKDPRESCRHGDLKPENILCFSNTDVGTKKIPIGVRLVVADAGHAKVHELATEFRGEPTGTPQGTIMYSPPEAELQLQDARSRRYDIWSLGCLYLEFLVWILYGNLTLESFRRDIGPGQPYYRKEPEVGLKEPVKEWIKAIKEDPRCAEVKKTAIGRLVTLIENRLLVVKVELRKDSFSEYNGSDPSRRGISPMSTEGSIKMILKRPTMDLSSKDAQRADAEEVYEEMKSIVNAVKRERSIPWINQNGIVNAAKRGPPTFMANLTPGDNRGALRGKDANGMMKGVFQTL